MRAEEKLLDAIGEIDEKKIIRAHEPVKRRFYRKWMGPVLARNTEQGTFHAPSGDLTCDMMHGGANAYYWGDHFSAVARGFDAMMGAMYFILPDEGMSVDELLSDGEAFRFLQKPDRWKNVAYPIIHLTLPKFDAVSDLDLIEGLKALGVTDVFDARVSDFTPMTRDMPAYVSKVEHAARVTVDEEGVVAAAYTVLAADGAGMPPEDEIDFVLDRPFLFVITGTTGLPLFVGIVNQP